MKYKKRKNIIYICIDRGEFINEQLTNVAVQENINTGWINGIGAIYDLEIGYFDISNKKYQRKTFKGEYELVSLIGNITIKNNSQFVHTHISFSDTDFHLYGGHLFDAKISAAGEFIIHIDEVNISRSLNSTIGLELWNIGNGCKID